jgi:glycosyltransferase involved in cell wall biosynthesis
MWQPTRDRFEHVMNVRGLVDLLRVGDQLAARGVKLHVAVPLLSDADCRRWLLEHPLNRWPTGTLTLAGFSEVPQVYLDADLFAFPYAEEITQFMPTSVIESMLVGTPVVLSGRRFLAPLIEAEVVTAYLPGDSTSLVTAIIGLLDDRVRWREQSTRAQEFASDRFDIHAAAKRLVEYATAAGVS